MRTTLAYSRISLMSLRRRDTASLNLSFTGTCTQPDDTGYDFISGRSPTVDISCGADACVARKIDGTAVAWVAYDPLAGGDAGAVDLTNVADISCGARACVALKTDNTAVAWGTPRPVATPVAKPQP